MPIGEDPGIDVRDIPLGTLRRRVSIVTQEIQLFSASVRDNLAFFNREIGDDRLREVLESLCLGAWLDGLPDRLLGVCVRPSDAHHTPRIAQQAHPQLEAGGPPGREVATQVSAEGAIGPAPHGNPASRSRHPKSRP